MFTMPSSAIFAYLQNTSVSLGGWLLRQKKAPYHTSFQITTWYRGFAGHENRTTAILQSVSGFPLQHNVDSAFFFFHSPSITSLLECLYYKLLVYVTWFLGLCLSSPHFFKITFLFPQLFLTLSSNCSL